MGYSVTQKFGMGDGGVARHRAALRLLCDRTPHIAPVRRFAASLVVRDTAPGAVSGPRARAGAGFYVCFVQCTLGHIMKNGDAGDQRCHYGPLDLANPHRGTALRACQRILP